MHTQRRIRFNKEALREYRLENNMEQTDFAKLLDTNPNVISYWETGRRTPLPKTINKISEITGIPHSILHGINEETLGTKLTTIRLSRNIRQNDVSERIGTSPESLNRWEADKNVPSAYFLYHIANVFDMTLDELITNKQGDLILREPYSNG